MNNKLYETLSKHSAIQLKQIIEESSKILEARKQAEALIIAEQTKRYITAYKKAVKEDRFSIAERYSLKINENRKKLEELGFLGKAAGALGHKIKQATGQAMGNKEVSLLKQRAGIKPKTPDDAAVDAYLRKYPTLDYITAESARSFTAKGQPGANNAQAIFKFVKTCQDWEKQQTTAQAYNPQYHEDPNSSVPVGSRTAA